MKQPQLVSTDSLNRMLRAAEEAWNRRDFQQNIELLERASRLDPANAGILLQLGRMYGLRYDYAAAERCYEKAVRIAPQKTQALWAAGMQSHDFHKLDLAEKYLRLAAEQKDATPDMLIHLADIYERLRRMDDVNKLVARALQ